MKHIKYSTVILGMLAFLLTGCEGGGGGSSDAAIERGRPGDFAISTCLDPHRLAGYDAHAVDELLALAVVIIEDGASAPLDKPHWDAFDFLSLALHELLHVKGVRGAHLHENEDGALAPSLSRGDMQRFLTAADWDLVDDAEYVFTLEYDGITDDCDVPIGFGELDQPFIGLTSYKKRVAFRVTFGLLPYYFVTL